MTAPQLVVRRVPEFGWALFDKASGEKADPDWWPTRKAALARKSVLDGQ